MMGLRAVFDIKKNPAIARLEQYFGGLILSHTYAKVDDI